MHSVKRNRNNGYLEVHSSEHFSLGHDCSHFLSYTGAEIGFDPSIYSVDEDAGVVTFYIQKKSNLNREVTVHFTTMDGTATGI